MGRIIASFWAMFAILHTLGMFVVDLFKSQWQLEAENVFLRHQLNIALRRAWCVPKTSSGDDFGFDRENSLFLNQNSLFRRNNSLLCCVGNFAGSV